MVVLPNRRGALFLKRYLLKVYQKAIWIPNIISIEEFIAQLSNLKNEDNLNLTFLLYESYFEVMQASAEPFDQFIKWSDMILQDFNEIDRYLIDAESIFKNLSDIKELDTWSLNREDKSQLQKNYLKFMSALGDIYFMFQKKLIEKGISYQGLAYRKSVENVSNSIVFDECDNILFAGFNALNKSEELIFDYFKHNKKSHFLCDGDRFYVNNPLHEAGTFIRKYLSSKLFNTDNFIEDHFSSLPKSIDIIGASQSFAQVATASELIKKWIIEGKDMNKTAIVLCDEELLFPLLNALPEEIQELNVSLEFPLFKSALFDLVLQLCNLHVSKKQSRTGDLIYFKDLLKVIQNPYFNLLFNSPERIFFIKKKIARLNITYFSVNQIEELFEEQFLLISFMFVGWEKPTDAIFRLDELGKKLLHVFSEKSTNRYSIEIEFTAEFIKLINKLSSAIGKINFINELATLRRILLQIQKKYSIPFYGEPLKGLQIMGVLETRTLDFENVILLSVNESILPSGKSNSSFFPYDLKRHFKLPVFQEKDAIYAYHFYRLLQRATNIALIYNTDADSKGKGEKSRFIAQCINELPNVNATITINEKIADSNYQFVSNDNEIVIPKTNQHIELLSIKATSGLSASLFNNYKDCSLRFYYNYIVKLKEQDEVEENIENNTMGTIFHEVLESIYKQFVGEIVSQQIISEQKKHIESYTFNAFIKLFNENDFKFGKNYLAYKTVQQHVKRVLDLDEKYAKEISENHDHLKIVGVEKELISSIEIELNNQPILLKITGKYDRMDRTNDIVRIVDYKSSISINDLFVYTDMETLFNSKNRNKLFQLFLYAWLSWKNNLSPASMLSPCIIPPKSKTGGIYYVLEKQGNRNIQLQFTDELLFEFEENLKLLIEGIFDINKSFIKTQDEKLCGYCTYKVLCSRDY